MQGVEEEAAELVEAGSSGGPLYRLELPCCRLEDAGAYSLVARNEHGEARAIVSLQVYVKGGCWGVEEGGEDEESMVCGVWV